MAGSVGVVYQPVAIMPIDEAVAVIMKLHEEHKQIYTPSVRTATIDDTETIREVVASVIDNTDYIDEETASIYADPASNNYCPCCGKALDD